MIYEEFLKEEEEREKNRIRRLVSYIERGALVVKDEWVVSKGHLWSQYKNVNVTEIESIINGKGIAVDTDADEEVTVEVCLAILEDKANKSLFKRRDCTGRFRLIDFPPPITYGLEK